jgi:hypothetical protein
MAKIIAQHKPPSKYPVILSYSHTDTVRTYHTYESITLTLLDGLPTTT